MTTHRIRSGGVALHVETLGCGPAVILCQGLGVSLADWPDGLIQVLSRRFRVVLVENRDSGRSSRVAWPYSLFDMAADVVAVADGLGLDRFAVPGCSMGGMIGQIVEGTHPERVSAFVQICGSCREATAPFLRRNARAVQHDGAGGTGRSACLAGGRHPAFRLPANAGCIRCAAPCAGMIAAGFSSDAFARQYHAIRSSGDRSHFLRTIQEPALVIAAQEDCCIPPSRAEYHCEAGAGHSVTPVMVERIAVWLEQAAGPALQHVGDGVAD